MQILNLSEEMMKEKINQRETRVCVVGLGKMGLPLAMVFTHAGFNVSGLDISEELVEMLNNGKTSINEPFVADRLKQALEEQRFIATTDAENALKDTSFVIFIIPVLTSEDGHADIHILESTYRRVREFAPKGIVYIQESTLPPGMTSGPLKSLLQEDGSESGIDFGLVFAPERTFSGRAIKDIEENYPKILGGDTYNAAIAAKYLYEAVCKKGVIKLSSATAAEAVKTFKGAYRDVNIAIANELAKLADLHGVDILEVIEAANSEPFSNIHRPGLGVGGHCIPVYPRFLIAQGIDLNYKPNVLDVSRTLNDSMVDYAIEILGKNINSFEQEILVLGLAYRGGVKEHRLSPTIRLVPLLRLKGAKVTLADPLYTVREVDAMFGEGTGKEWTIELVKSYDLIIIATDHEEFKAITECITGLPQKTIFDGRYVLDPNNEHIILQPGRLVYSK
ncbi:MAG: nucleotide sugar dehydrogenase [Candidatus Heimdallarchaeota archaeon]|nr:nucleotide sugar dehydrogenase [Candidatus Heimdallarchaeota archaeon]